MKDLYPDHIWHDWLFKEGAPRVFWQQAKNQQQYLLWLQKQLNINDPSDWYRVSSVDFSQNHGSSGCFWSSGFFCPCIHTIALRSTADGNMEWISLSRVRS
jgi:hypothetical protein